MEEVKTLPVRRTPEEEYPDFRTVWEQMREEGQTDKEILSFLDSFA